MLRAMMLLAGVVPVTALVLGCSRAGRAGRMGSLDISPDEIRAETAPSVPKDARRVAFLEGPVIDGDLSEWAEAAPLLLGTPQDAVHGRAWLAWDWDRFYLACEVVDPHFANSGVEDSASLENCLILDFDGFSGTDESSPERMSFALTRRGVATSWDILHREDPGACVVKKTGKDTYVYEIALTWHDVQPIAPGLTGAFGLDVLYQYLDGQGRRRCVRWQKDAGSDPERRGFGAVALEPTQRPSRQPRVYVGPNTFSVGKDGVIRWRTLLALDKDLPGVRLCAEVSPEGQATPSESAATAVRTSCQGTHLYAAAWKAEGFPGGSYILRMMLKDASGKALASDFFRVRKAPTLDVRKACDELSALCRELEKQQNPYYRRDLDSVELRMESLRAYVDAKVDAERAVQLERIVDETGRMLRAMLAGKDYFGEARGYVIRGFRSPYDDTLQLYEVFVPKDYDPKKKYPLIVNLHGAGGDALGTLDGTYTARYFPDPDWQHLQLMPFARGRSGYRSLGLTEVLDTIDYVKKLYSVDDGRVCLKGFSMGGGGTWFIALHYPHRFAAANPRAGFTAYREYDRLEGKDAAPDWQTAVGMTGNAMLHAENANNLPLFLYHGGSDPVISAENTYRMWERLRSLGGTNGLFIYHHYQHVWAMDMDAPATGFMLKYRRNSWPDRVIYNTNNLRFARAYWVTVERLEDPMRMARIDALKQSDGSVTVETKNVEAFSLDLSPEVVAGPRVEIAVNGRSVYKGEIPPTRSLTVEKTADEWKLAGPPAAGERVKRAGLGGPIDDAYYGRVLYVYGTRARDEALRAELKRLAEERSGQKDVLRYQGGKRCAYYPVKADTEVTDDDIRRAHLELIGGPSENLITARVAEKLPVRFAEGSFSLRAKPRTGTLQGVRFICPNPLAPDRYVIVTAANSLKGYALTSDARLNLPDWVVTEEGGIKEGGYFSNRWE